MTKSEFLAVSARELDGYFDQIEQREHSSFLPAALVCSVIANVNRDPEQKPEPWHVEDFMPGAESDEENMRRFCEKVARGESFADDPEALNAMAGLKEEFKARFKIKSAGNA